MMVEIWGDNNNGKSTFSDDVNTRQIITKEFIEVFKNINSIPVAILLEPLIK